MEQAPPYPTRVVGPDGSEITGKEAIMKGQHVWRKYGLMDNGSVWGHGTHRSRDYSASSLYTLGDEMRSFYAQQRFGLPDAELAEDRRSVLDSEVIREIKKNRLNSETNVPSLTEAQVYALEQLQSNWNHVFSKGELEAAIWPNVVKTAEERKDFTDFLFWTVWTAGTTRPGKALTYTNNWPPNRSVGNEISSQAVIWSIVSLLGFKVAVGAALAFFFKGNLDKDLDGLASDQKVGDKLVELPVSSSQQKTAKYFLVGSALFILQLMMGGRAVA